MSNSLFGYLAQRFASSPENLATESLLYILQRSQVARHAFFRYLEQTGCVNLPDDLRLASQCADQDDQSIPDLVGFDMHNHPVLICESKFWAGLTGNQPVSYLEQLVKGNGSLLLVLGPSKRAATLWPELVHRVVQKGFHVEYPKEVSGEMLFVIINERYVLAFASWRSVLSVLSYALKAENDLITLGDLVQLQGLCDHMDTTAFLPLHSGELTGNVGQRIQHYCDLVDESAVVLSKNGIASLEGLRASGSRGWYGRYVYVGKYGCLLQFNANFWSKYGATPIWFSIQDATDKKKWVPAIEARGKLVSLESKQPPRLFLEGDLLLVPILLPYGVEKAEVIDSICLQVQQVTDLLTTDNA